MGVAVGAGGGVGCGVGVVAPVGAGLVGVVVGVAVAVWDGMVVGVKVGVVVGAPMGVRVGLGVGVGVDGGAVLTIGTHGVGVSVGVGGTMGSGWGCRYVRAKKSPQKRRARAAVTAMTTSSSVLRDRFLMEKSFRRCIWTSPYDFGGRPRGLVSLRPKRFSMSFLLKRQPRLVPGITPALARL